MTSRPGSGRSRLHACVAVAALLPLVVEVPGCADPHPVEIVTVSLRNTEIYQYPTVGGDEEGAIISTQARHFAISEIRRGPETNWVATYVYLPAAGHVGPDYAEIEIHTGSDGASPPTNVKRIGFRFEVHD